MAYTWCHHGGQPFYQVFGPTNHLATTERLVAAVATTTYNNVVGVLGLRNGAASITFLVWKDSPADLFDAVESTPALAGVAGRVIITANVEKRPIC